MSDSEAKPSGGIARFLVPVALLFVLALVYREPIAREVRAFADWVDTLGVWGPVVFILGYVIAALAFLPGSILTLAAGVIFGLAKGAVYVFIAASLSACAAFLLARSFAREAIQRRLAGNRRFAAVDRAIAREGMRIVFLLRLSPLFPFSLGNYALGLTRISFRDYALACTGMIPGTFVYVYLGSVVGKVGGSWQFVAGLLVTVVVVFLITRIAKRALAEATDEAPPAH